MTLHDEASRLGRDGVMAKPPESTKTSLRQKLAARTRERWPQLAAIDVGWHGQFAYVSGQLPDGTSLPLRGLRYADSATTWGFAIYRAATTTTRNRSCPTAGPPAPGKKPSTAPAASTSATTPPGSARHPPTN